MEQETRSYRGDREFTNTVGFMEQALAEHAHLKPCSPSERNLDATLTYLLSPPHISLKDTGEIYDVTRERMRQVRDKTIRDLRSNCEPCTQKKFPLEKLELNKPRPYKAKEKPVKKERSGQELANNLRKAETDQEKQQLLDSVSHSLYRRYVGGEDPLLVAVRNLATKVGYHLYPRNYILFQKTIINACIPMGTIEVSLTKKSGAYHFIFVEDQERARGVLRRNANLERFLRHPVRQISGPKEDKLPSSSIIKKRTDFKTIGGLLFEFGLSIKEAGIIRRKIIEEGKIPIFFYEHKYWYPADREPILRESMKRLTLPTFVSICHSERSQV